MPKLQVKLANVELQMKKRCSKCKVEKPISGFYKSKREKDGFCYCCKDCMKQHYQEHKKEKLIYAKKYVKLNKKSITKARKQYRQDNKDIVREWGIIYREKHKVEKQMYDKQRYENNKKKRILQIKLYNQENREEKAEYNKKYSKTDQGKTTRKRARYKRRILKLNGLYEIFDPVEIFKRDGYICQLCGKKTRPDYKNYNHSLYSNLDHIIPLSKGGAHTRLNTQCSCHQCNLIKSANNHNDQLRMFG